MPEICDSVLSHSVVCESKHSPENDKAADTQKLVSKPPNFRNCSICHVEPARYRCPACSAATCSCSCVKRHKLQTNCTGVREPVPAVQKEDMDDEMLQRDYRFLESVLSRLEQCIRDPRVHHIDDSNHPYKRRNEQRKRQREEEESLVYKHRFSQSFITDDMKRKFSAVIPDYGGRARRHTQVTLHRGDLSSALKRLRYEAKQRGTELVFMPRDMSRHTTNTSHYSNKALAIRWRVRVEFVQADAYFEATFDENISIGRIASKFLSCPVDDLRGWSCGELCDASHGRPLETGEKVKCKSSTRHEDPLKEYWSEGVAYETGDAKVVPVTSPSETKKCPTNTPEKSKILHGTSTTNEEEVPIQTTSNQSKKTSVSFANEDVIKMTLNSVYHSTDASCGPPAGPLALDITRAPKVNNPKPLSDAQADQMVVYQAAGTPQLSVLFKNENFYDHRRYVEMCSSDSLKESLTGLRVVEYPIFSVFMKDHAYELASVKQEIQARVNDADSDSRTQDKTFKYFDAECAEDFIDES